MCVCVCVCVCNKKFFSVIAEFSCGIFTIKYLICLII